MIERAFMLLFLVGFLAAAAPSSDGSFAERLLGLGLIDDAEDEAMFFEPTDYRTLYSIALSRVKLNEIDKAIKTLDLILDESRDNELRIESYRLIVALEIISLNLNAADKYARRANREFDGIFSKADLKEIEIIAAMNSQIDTRMRRRSPTAARIFSLLLPGSGQVYCGEYWNGIRSAAVDGAIGYLVVGGLAQGYYARALTVFYFFGARYWLGGAERAATFAEDFNRAEWKRAAMDSRLAEGIAVPTNEDNASTSTLKPLHSPLTPVRLTAKTLLDGYQNLITDLDARECPMSPSCSEFSRRAFSKTGFARALFLTSDRLIRDNSFAKRYYHKNKNGKLVDPVERYITSCGK